MTANIVCMKWGSLYGPHYVNRLFHGVRRNLDRDFRFLCFTDDAQDIVSGVECHPLPRIHLPESENDRRWIKLGVFREGLAEMRGSCLFLDLDVVIVDSIDGMFDYEPGAFCISHDWWMPHKHLLAKLLHYPKIGNTSVFRFEAGSMNFALTDFEAHCHDIIARFPLEQGYVTHAAGNRIRWWPQTWVRSFRRHCRPVFPMNWIVAPSVPAGAKVVAFHGLPKLDQAVSGYASRYPHKRCRPSAWVEKHWRLGD